MKASREELVKFWTLQSLLDFYCFEVCGCKGYCLVWCDNGISFKVDLVDLCPYEVARKVMVLLHKMLRHKPASHYTPRGEEYEEVMAEVEERLKGDVAVILDAS